MPASPTQTAGWFRGKNGWFNEREEKIMVNRVLRDDPSKGGMHNRQAVTPKMLWEALKDYDMWIIYLVGLTWMIPNTPATSYISLELKSLGFSTFHTNLLTIPAYVIFIVNLLWITWVSEKFNQRLLLGVFAEFWALVLLVALEVLPDHASAWARWILISLLLAMPYVHAIVVAITSRNAGTVRTRTVATALYNMSVQVSTIIGNNVSRPDPWTPHPLLTVRKDLPREWQTILPHWECSLDCFGSLEYATFRCCQVLLHVAKQVCWWAFDILFMRLLHEPLKFNTNTSKQTKCRHLEQPIERGKGAICCGKCPFG